jgi:hypothetical protein
MGENAKDGAQWLPNALPLWELHSHGSSECLEPWLERKKNTKSCLQDTIRKVLKHRCLKCPRIIHLHLICISYDQKKGRESNWEFDSRSQTLWKQGSNEFWLGHVIHCWKGHFEGYKILHSHLQKKLIWKRYERPKSWDSKSFSFETPHFGQEVCAF